MKLFNLQKESMAVAGILIGLMTTMGGAATAPTNIYAGNSVSYISMPSGQTYGFGANYNNEMFYNSNYGTKQNAQNFRTPATVASGPSCAAACHQWPQQNYGVGIESIAPSQLSNFVLKLRWGKVNGIGNNYSGQLGTGTTADIDPSEVMNCSYSFYTAASGYYFPQVTDASKVKAIAIAAGAGSSYILKSDKSLWVCGSNSYGQLGIGSTIDQLTPVRMKQSASVYITNVVGIAAGGYHVLILLSNGNVMVCGNNEYGQIGNGGMTNLYAFQIGGLNGVKKIAAGGFHSLFLKTDGTLWACGYNGDGELGDRSYTNRFTPVKIATNVTDISAGAFHTSFCKTIDASRVGLLYTCGWGFYGQLGNGTGVSTNNPAIIDDHVQKSAAGMYHTLYQKTDGTVWACGANLYGELGDGTYTTRNSPVRVNIPQ